MSITSSLGLGSGLDINSLVSQLVQADGAPTMNALDSKQKTTQTHISALGTLQGALSAFQTAVTNMTNNSAFKAVQATSSNTTLATVTAAAGTPPGNYTVEVNALATPQKAITKAGFTDLNANVGEGTLTFAVGTKTPFSITVDSTNNTLANIRDAINGSAANNGVVASIVNVDNGTGGTVSKLELSSKNPGIANGFTVSGTATGGAGAGLSQLFTPGLTPISTPADAVITVDGQTATRSTNNISDVIPGVTLNLLSAPAVTTPPTAATPFNVNIATDSTTITNNVNGFVTAYNTLQGVMGNLGSYDPTTNTAGDLNGDPILTTLKSQIRQIASTVVGSAASSSNSLAMIGISVDQKGVMSLDSTKFSNALNTNPNALSQVFTATDGVATRYNNMLTQYLQSGGTFDSQNQSLNKALTNITTDRAAEQARLDSEQKTLLKQFQAMDQAVGQYKATGTYLTQRFG